MASFFRGYGPDQALPATAVTHPWAGEEVKRVERVVAAILTEWRQTTDPADKIPAVVHILESELVIDALVREASATDRQGSASNEVG